MTSSVGITVRLGATDVEIDKLTPEAVVAFGSGKIEADKPGWNSLVELAFRVQNLLKSAGVGEAISAGLDPLRTKRISAEAAVRDLTEAARKACAAYVDTRKNNGRDLAVRQQALQTAMSALDDEMVAYFELTADLVEFMNTTFHDEVEKFWVERTALLIKKNFSNEFPRIHEAFEGAKMMLVPVGMLANLIPAPGAGLAISYGLGKAVDLTEDAVSGLVSRLAALDKETQLYYAQFEEQPKKKNAYGKAEGGLDKLSTATDVGREIYDNLSDIADEAPGISDAGSVGGGGMTYFLGTAFSIMEDSRKTREFYSHRNPQELVEEFAKTIVQDPYVLPGSTVELLSVDASGWRARINGIEGHFSKEFRFTPDNRSAAKKMVLAAATKNGVRLPADIKPLLDGAQWNWEQPEFLDESPDGFTYRVSVKRKTFIDLESMLHNWDPKKDPFRGSFEFQVVVSADGGCSTDYPFFAGDDIDGTEINSLAELVAHQLAEQKRLTQVLKDEEEADAAFSKRVAERQKEADKEAAEWDQLQREMEANKSPEQRKAEEKQRKAAFHQMVREMDRKEKADLEAATQRQLGNRTGAEVLDALKDMAAGRIKAAKKTAGKFIPR